MFTERKEEIRRLLSAEFPLHYRVLHNADPERLDHRESVEAIAVRRILCLLEDGLEESCMDREDPWISGLAEGLGCWVRTATRRDSWALSIALEARDRLWEDGHPVHPREDWEVTIPQLLALAGVDRTQPVQLESWEEIRPFRTPLRIPEKSSTPTEAGVLVLRAISKALPPVRVLEIAPDGSVQTAERPRRWIERGQYWPLGPRELRERRKQAVQFLYDSLHAAESWARPHSVDVNRLCDIMTEQLHARTDLWAVT